MDKLITTNNGGMPFDLDDLRWIDQGVTASFKAIAKALNLNSETGFRLFGAEVTDAGSTYNVAAGAIFAADEIWLVNGHSVAKLAGSGSYYWKQVITYDVTGSETFESGATVETYQIRRLQFTNTDLDGAASGSDILGIHLLSMSDAWTTTTVFNTLSDQINNANTGINSNLVRSANVRQIQNVGSSYANFTDLTGFYSSRGGDPELHASGVSLGINFKKNRLYRLEFNGVQYAADVIRIKNVPSSHVLFAGFESRDASGNVDINPSQTDDIFMVNTSATDVTLTFAVKYDGNLLINVTDMGKY
jgi:hypothetical protein